MGFATDTGHPIGSSVMSAEDVLNSIWRLAEVGRRRTCQQSRTDVCRVIVRFVFNINYGEECVCV
jgi:hypothetical protein